MSLPEIVAALTIAALGIGAGAPAVSGMIRTHRLNGAARDMAVELQRARMEAVARGAYTGILFERSAGSDRWRLHQDGGDRGIHTSEIAAGIDAPIGRAYDLGARYQGVRIGIAATPAIPRIPPATGMLSPSDDPIAFGSSDIFSAAPTGETSSGTLYLTDGRDMRAVVVYGATGRIRLWRFDAREGVWRP
jgi:Tfp pilus assembly protein FimT